MTSALEPQSSRAATPAHSGRGWLTGWIRAHPLVAFVGLSYALSWGYWLPLILTGQIVRLGSTVTQFPGLLSPVVAVRGGDPGGARRCRSAGHGHRSGGAGPWWLQPNGRPA